MHALLYIGLVVLHMGVVSSRGLLVVWKPLEPINDIHVMFGEAL